MTPEANLSQSAARTPLRATGCITVNERYAAHENANGSRSVRCPICGRERTCRGRRWKRVYCSDACRARAWRRQIQAVEETNMNTDGPSGSRKAIGGGGESGAMLCSGPPSRSL